MLRAYEDENNVAEIKRAVDGWFDEGFTKQEAFSESAAYIRDSLEECINNLDDYDLVALLTNYNDEFHTMDDLDDVYDYMSVTEILKDLRDIDPDDEYFNSCSNTSGNDIWVVSDVRMSQLTRDLQRGEFDFDNDDINEIVNLEEVFNSIIEEKWGIYERAKALFDMLVKEDPQAVINALWNLGVNE